MRHFENLADQSFGRLTAIQYMGRSYWMCRCVCGTEKRVRASHLKDGNVASCGCLKATKCKGITTHGHSPRGTVSPTYGSWHAMRQRCGNPKNPKYKYYGGRGVTVCERWRSFSAFLEDMGPRPKDLTLDRADPEKHYSPENCRWATRAVQDANKRKRHPSLSR